ncbi:hypothetical protein [Halorussus pelagicus]|nr:hypothetical protein [Halorussus pelagicus]
MDLSRLGTKRAKRTKTWAAVCAGLFATSEPDESGSDDARNQ